MIKKVLPILFLLCLPAYGGVTKQQTFLFPAQSFDSVWGATIEAVADCGFLIENLDKAAGIISATKERDPLLENNPPNLTVTVKNTAGGVSVLVKYVTPGQVVDYGRGKKAIAKISQSINDNLNYSPKIESKYDRFRNATDISSELRYPVIGMDPAIQLVTTFEGQELKELPPTSLILFISCTVDWRFLNYSETYLLIDGERSHLGNPNRSSEVKEGSVLEILSFTVDTEIVKKLSLAEKIEVKIGMTEFELTSRGISNIRAFMKAITPAI